MKQNGEDLDGSGPHRLALAPQRVAEDADAPAVAHAPAQKGQQRHAVRLDFMCWNHMSDSPLCSDVKLKYMVVDVDKCRAALIIIDVPATCVHKP